MVDILLKMKKPMEVTLYQEKCFGQRIKFYRNFMLKTKHVYCVKL